MKKILLTLIILFPLFSSAQGEASWWFFGENAGLDFNSGAPLSVTTGALNTFEGCSTISDECGNLLMYSDGSTIWNRNHQPMPNGTGLSGNSSSAQSAIIIPDLQVSSVYFVVTIGSGAGLRYSIVNMNLDGGLGDVVPGRNDILVQSNTQEKVTAALNDAGDRYWIVTFDNPTYTAYKAGGGLIDTNPARVVSSNIPQTNTLTDARGYIRLSPDGSKVANTSIGNSGAAWLCDFNNATGVVSNPVELRNGTSNSNRFYGAEFSPNSQLLYLNANSQDTGNGCGASNVRQVIQFDLNGGTGWNTSPVALGNVTGAQSGRGALQLGIDGRIYQARTCQPWLGMIRSPNVVGTAANYVDDAVPLSNPTRSREGLPPFITSFFEPSFLATDANQGTGGGNNNPTTDFCDGTPIQFDSSGSGLCATATVLWDFGDGTTDNTFDPIHTFPGPGDYTVTLTVTSGFYSNTAIDVISIYEIPVANPVTNVFLCDSDGDGFEDRDLTTVETPQVLDTQTNPDFVVTYFLTQNAADNNTGAISMPYSFPIGTTTVFARITNDVNVASRECFDTTSFDVIVAAGSGATAPTPLIACDDNNDGFFTFDLTTVETEVLNGLPASQFTITYHNSASDAQADQNSILNPTSYTNTVVGGPETIHVRMEDNNPGGCNSTTSFDISVFDSPTANSVTDSAVCDTGNDNTEDIVLTDFDTEVLNSQTNTNYVITYHLSQADADADTGALSSPYSITGTTTFYARIDNSLNEPCYNTTSFTITLDAVPVANPVTEYRLCDDVSNNGSEVFDLSTKNPELLGSQNPADFNIEYFTSQADADLGSAGGATPVINNYSSAGQTMYVRIENINNTDCYDSTTFDLIVDDLPVAAAPTALVLCDDASNDGVADVDLATEFDAAVLNGQTTATYVVTYHGSQADADADAAALSSPYQVNLGTNTIYARIDNSDNEVCYSTIPFDIILNAQAVANPVTEYRLCDIGNDGVENFDLTTKDVEVLDTQNPANFNIEYFTSQTDATLGSAGGATPLASPYNSGNATIYVRIENVNNTDCFDDSVNFDLIVDDLPVAAAPTTLVLCDDTSNDGVADVDLATEFDAAVLNGQTTATYVVTYHGSQADADANAAALSSPYQVNLGTNTIYARIDNSDNEVCYSTIPFDIILNAQAVANPVTEYRLCDIGNDGVEDFDLTTKDVEVLGTQNPANFNIEYFTSQADAALGSAGGATPLASPYNSGNATIYVRIENVNNTDCFDDTVSFDIFVDEIPVAGTPANIIVCDDPSNDGVEDVDLSQFDTDILNGQTNPNFVVSYHSSQADADNDANPLSSPYSVSSTTPNLYARIDNGNNNDCYTTSVFQFIISTTPTANPAQDMITCDDPSNDGVEDFDLTSKDAEVLDAQNPADFNIEYFTSQADATLGSVGGATPLISPYNSGNATIYVRIENVTNPSCAEFTDFELIINELPVTTTPANLILCDISSDGVEDIDLSSQFDAAILNGQTNSNFVITYHSSQADADADTGALSSPYQVSLGTITLYARIDNATNESCDATTSFTITLDEQAVANPVVEYILCDDMSNDGVEDFDLTSKDVEVLGSQNPANFNIEYFTSQADATLGSAGGATPLTSPYNSGNATIYVRIENINNTSCFDDSINFTLTVSEQPTAGVAMDQRGCDDISNDGIEDFDFTGVDTEILNGLNPADFTVTYHSSQADADAGTGALSFPYTNTTRAETIYARIENNANTDCYDTSSFGIEVFERPVIADQGSITICAGIDEILDAGAGYTSYLWSTGDTTQTITVNSEDDYEVTVFNADGCDSTATIRVIESDVAIIQRIDVEQFEVNTNQLTAIVTGSGDYEYSLDDFVYQDSPRFSNLYPGYYTVYVRDRNGCGTVSMDAVIIGGPPYFTPNQDGYHDTWQVIAVETIPDANIYIFDRYGKLIKQISAQGSGWDGTFNGNPMPSSDYWYLVELSDGNSFKGHFALKR